MATLKTFSKKWLLSLSDQPPVKRTEYRDTEYKYLRAIVQPSGHASLSVYKAPIGHQRAVRRTLSIRVDEHMPPVSEVRSKAAEKVRDIDEGEVKGEVITLDDGLRLMLKNAVLKQRTIDGYRRNVEHLKDWKLKPMTGDAKAIVKMHRKITKAAGPVAANNALRTYRRILNVCLASGDDVPIWPTEKLKVLKLWAPEVARTKRRLNRDDFPVVWGAIDSLEPMRGDLMRFWLLTGCRRREATDLTVDDVDFRLGTVTFTDTKNKLPHTLPLTPTLDDLLKRRRKASEDGLLCHCTEPKSITRLLERATGVHITPHDCRRTFAGVAELAGVGSHTVGVLLNHKSGSVTGGYIGELDNKALRKALLKIERRILKLATW
jgi:integrase